MRYIDRGGELCWSPPYLVQGVQFFGFIIPCGLGALQAQADRYLNAPLQESGRFVPATPHAMIVFNSIDRMQSKVTPHWGYTTEQEMATWLLLTDTRTRRLCWFHPYMFVDNDAAMVSGRELYGFPKALGWFEIPRGPAAPDRISVETMLVRRFGDDARRERAPLIVAKRILRGDAGETATSLRELTTRVVARLGLNLGLFGDFELAAEALGTLLRGDVPMVFLKQLRSAENPQLASFQCVQQVAARVDAFHAARLYVGSRYQLDIHDADSHPIRRDLGLSPGPIDVALGYWLNFDLSIGECSVLGHGIASPAAPKQRIAILGGGMGSITTAFELTNEADWQSRYEITLYQLGHRLGGKGASGRGAQGRIEEHGLHVWLGFYENAFRIIRQVYAELSPHGAAPGAPEFDNGVFTHWQRAFSKHSLLGVYDRDADGRWSPWQIRFPEDSAVPGDPSEERTLRSLITQLIEWMVDAARTDTLSQVWRTTPVTPDANLLSRLQCIGSDLSLGLDVAAHSIGLATLQTLLGLVKRMPQKLQRGGQLDKQLTSQLQTLQRWILEQSGRGHPQRRRLLLILDLTTALARGLIADLVIGGRELASLEEDFRAWLRRHGAREHTTDLNHNALLRGLYDFVFAFVDGECEQADLSASFEAGVAIRTILRMFLTYRGAIFWKMNAGMGDTVFTPFYKVLKQRGVRFEFFSKVDQLVLSEDGSHVEAIEITRQATPASAEYAPFVRIGELDCWPAKPHYAQLLEGPELEAQQVDLESVWSNWPGAGKLVLRRGAAGATGFERVVFGLSLGTVPWVCRSLVETKPAWRDMVKHVRTVRTMGVQLWLRSNLQQLGWTLPPPVSTAFGEPLDTWADMSHVLRHEAWPVAPGSLAYFCGPLRGPEPDPRDMQTPQLAREEVERAVGRLLGQLRDLWPNAYANGSHALDPEEILSSYVRANVDPSERYVLSVAGSSRYRLRADGSGVSNLTLTGDWIDNGYNAGCVEAAVLGGIQAANALRGRERMHGVLGRALL